MTKQIGSYSDWGAIQNKIKQTRAKPQNNTKHGEGHADHEEVQARDQVASRKNGARGHAISTFRIACPTCN
jgi:hypothetical protein